MTAFTATTNGIPPIRQPVTVAHDPSPCAVTSTRRTSLLTCCRIGTHPFVEELRAGRTGRPAEETEPDMSTTQIPTLVTSTAGVPTADRQPVWQPGVAAAVVASVTTTVLAAVASAAGVSFAGGDGASIPIAGF